MARKRKTYTELATRAESKPVEEQRTYEWPTAVYARLSIENSGKDDKGESIEGQVEICRDYVDEHPYLHFTDTYVDNGWTGTNTERPEFQRLLGDIHAGKIKALVIKDFSRFSRDYIEAGNLLENVFPAMGVRFISVADRYDSFETDGSTSSLLIPIKNLINSYYSKDISKKVSTALQARQLAASYIPSMIPYGYMKSTTRAYRFEPDPETAGNVTRIFQMRVDGVPLNRIASTLQNEGIPSPGKLRYQRGQTTDKRYATSKWSAQLIKQILKNPTYLGHLAFGRMPTALYLGKPDYHYEPDESKWRVLENMHEPLVSQEIFDRAKAMAAAGQAEHKERLARTAAYREKNLPLFNGILFCGDCGAKMVYHRNLFFAERLTGSYDCPHWKYETCNAPHTIQQDVVKDAVWQTVQDQLAYCCDYEAVLNKLKGGGTTLKMDEYRSKMQSLTIQLHSRRDKRERLYEDFTDGIITAEEYMVMKKRYDDEYQLISGELADIQGRLARLKKSLSGQNKWLVHIRQFSDAQEFSPEMVEALVEKILVFQDEDGKKRLEIRFKYGADRELLTNACKEIGGEGK
jgi:DNA invertase Pin-like site-specific DNA recombinase